MNKLDGFLKENQVNIAAITVPKDYAAETAKLIASYGIKGIWNFAQVDLDSVLPKDIVVQNVHLIESLMELSYNLEH